MPDLKEVERNADFIYSMYTFTLRLNHVDILNLQSPIKVIKINYDDFVLETTMEYDEIEKVLEIYHLNKKKINKIREEKFYG